MPSRENDNFYNRFVAVSNGEIIQNKEVFVYVIQAYTPNEYVLDNYKFLRSSDIINIDINNTTIGNTISINQEVIKTTYLIFLDENKQPAEKREENLNKIL